MFHKEKFISKSAFVCWKYFLSIVSVIKTKRNNIKQNLTQKVILIKITKELNFEILKIVAYFLIPKNKLKLVYKIICVQKQSSRGVLRERCSTNMKQMHRRTTMCKRDLKKAHLKLYWNHTHALMHPTTVAAHPQDTLLQGNISGGMLLYVKEVLKGLSFKKLLFTVITSYWFVIKIMIIIIITVIITLISGICIVKLGHFWTCLGHSCNNRVFFQRLRAFSQHIGHFCNIA